ncbi:unnamed protein product [Pleuronectes platessa]|uniref:Uncharacterized protein n=1 Tax=Pleuronectes platessa TaxID=8262 RepID=A0A9N7ZDF3_PLEPL|nr:unnamed protein product [Pleuronectes platessa]
MRYRREEEEKGGYDKTRGEERRRDERRGYMRTKERLDPPPPWVELRDWTESGKSSGSGTVTGDSQVVRNPDPALNAPLCSPSRLLCLLQLGAKQWLECVLLRVMAVWQMFFSGSAGFGACDFKQCPLCRVRLNRLKGHTVPLGPPPIAITLISLNPLSPPSSFLPLTLTLPLTAEV